MDSQYENTPRHPCDSHFPKGISALSWSFLLENWNKTNVYEMITHYTSCQQCRTVSNSVNSVNSVNSFNCVNSVNNVNSVNCYSAVLPPSPMVFFLTIAQQHYYISNFHPRDNIGLVVHSISCTSLPLLWYISNTTDHSPLKVEIHRRTVSTDGLHLKSIN